MFIDAIVTCHAACRAVAWAKMLYSVTADRLRTMMLPANVVELKRSYVGVHVHICSFHLLCLCARNRRRRIDVWIYSHVPPFPHATEPRLCSQCMPHQDLRIP